MTDRLTWWYSPEHQEEQRRKGRVLNASGGYSTKKEIRDFIKSLKQKRKEMLVEIDKRIKDHERSL